MLRHIALYGYDDEEITYRTCLECNIDDYQKIYNRPHNLSPDVCVKNWIEYDSLNLFDECGMERLIMLVAGMLFCIENGGIADDDPVDLAYNAWLAIQDFKTGEFDDLFTPDDLIELKNDIARIDEYFDAHPKLKG
ncbi:MAG: hypothetical protein ACI4KM_00805 [Oscillospiraceae bacterium]